MQENERQRAETTDPVLLVVDDNADVMMPEMDGFAMGRALMNIPMTAGIPLLYLTARATVHDTIDGLRIGADAYLAKPFDRRLLRARVEGLIQKQMHLPAVQQEQAAEQASESAAPDDSATNETAEALCPPPSSFMEAMHRAIQTHMSDPEFGVAELADALALSRSQLYRRLDKESDHTPGALLRNERMKHAHMLLRTGQGNVSEVAYAVGFSSLSHFSTTFRKQYEVAPSTILPNDFA